MQCRGVIRESTLEGMPDPRELERMNVEWSGELQLHRHRVNDFGYGERSNEASGQFPALDLQGEVRGGQPNLLTSPIARSR